jgi:ankyrin repeat protein
MKSIRRLSLLIAFALVSTACIKDANSMNARDYFTSPAELAFVDAVSTGDVRKLERLVAQGADVNARGRDGMTPAFWALAHLSKGALAFLLEHGADPNAQLIPDGNSVMSISAMGNDSWYLREAIDHGGNVNLVNPVSCHTPIFDAMLALRDENVRILIAAHADLNTVDKMGNTPAIVAAGQWRYDWVYELLNAGADPTVRTPAGITLLTRVRRVPITPANPNYPWKLKVVELLKERGLDVDHGR